MPMKVELLSPEEREKWENSDEYITVYRAVASSVEEPGRGRYGGA